MTSKRPYLVRAMHEWLEDTAHTPYLLINANAKGVIAPQEYANDGKLVLAISYRATKDLLIDNHAISFSARFGGVPREVYIPMRAVLGIYAKEDPDEAFFFDPHEYDNIDDSDDLDDADTGVKAGEENQTTSKPNHLKFI